MVWLSFFSWSLLWNIRLSVWNETDFSYWIWFVCLLCTRSLLIRRYISLYINIHAIYRLVVSIILPENEFVFFSPCKIIHQFLSLNFLHFEHFHFGNFNETFCLAFCRQRFYRMVRSTFCVLLLTIQFCGC